MTEVVGGFSISIDQIDGYQFRVDFHKESLAPMIVDEPPPLGNETGPTPTKLLASSVASCLCASLLFCAGKVRVGVKNIHAEVKVQTVRNDRKRLRIGRIEVAITPQVEEAERARARRCLELFEEFCTVTQSVRDGIDIDVSVEGFDDQSEASPAA
ncbi:MAG: OsmC family protein [Bryobacteraceae bacterium]|nr:OsmC family protein [Bryobacteraceae bacterium]